MNKESENSSSSSAEKTPERDVDELDDTEFVFGPTPESLLLSLKQLAMTVPYAAQLYYSDVPEEKDIEWVMVECDVSRDKAIAALRESDGDVVEAIMSLCSS